MTAKMSDDEELIYKKPQKTIHYGSLENSNWLKQQNTLEEIQSDEDDYEPESKKPAIAAATTSSTNASNAGGNINISNEYLDLSEHEM